MDWDFDIEIHYDERVGKRRLALTCVLALCITLTAVTAIDSVKPRFRGDELTVEEFSKNYNNTLSLMYDDPDSTMKLQPDGKWIQRDDGSFVVVVGATPEIENANFSYETENGILRSVSYSQHYTDVAWISPIGTKCFTAAITALLSQEGCGFGDLVKFVKTWEKELAKSNTDFQYKNIRIQWQIEASDNLHQSDGTFYAIGNDVYGEIYISFCLTITSK